MAKWQRGFMRLANSLPFRELGMKCYIGGSTEREAGKLFKGLHNAYLTPMVDLVGESVRTMEDAKAAAEIYIYWMKICRDFDVRFFSLKPSHMGLGIDYNLAHDMICQILETARTLDAEVECDAESPSLLERTYNLALALKRSGGGFRRVAVPANQGCICQGCIYQVMVEGRRCIVPTGELCLDRHLIAFRMLGISIRVVKGAYYPGDIPETLVNQRFLNIAKSNRHSAGATHDFPLLIAGFPYFEEVQMLYGIRMLLQMKIAKLIEEGRLLEWYLRERTKMGTLRGISALSLTVPKRILTYVPLGSKEATIQYLSRRYEEGMRPSVFPLFLMNVPESLWWRMRFAPETLFS